VTRREASQQQNRALPVRTVGRKAVVGVFLLALLGVWVWFIFLRPAPLSLLKPRSIILICIDTLRSDHVSFGGYQRITTPNLDALAADEGITFENAYAAASWTLPSVMSVFTSMHPPHHGVEDRGTRLSEAVTTLPERLAADGWLTAAFVTHIYVSSLFGFEQGFTEFRELSIDWGYKEGLQLQADELNRQVVPWIAGHTDSRSFLYLHYFDPHWDYRPPPPFVGRYTDPDYSGPADGTWDHLKKFISTKHLMPEVDLQHTVDLYDGEILWTDHQLGLLFEEMKSRDLWDDSLVVIFGDHGEEFQDHGSVHHIRTLYEEVLRVPLLVKLPGGRPRGVRSRVPERVRLVDLAPTILDLVGSETSPEMEGASLVPLLTTQGPDRDVFAHTVRHAANKMALLSGGWKLIYTYRKDAESVELFDLVRDPYERSSVHGQMPEVARDLKEEAKRRFSNMLQLQKERLLSTSPVELTPEQEEHLRRLGYAE